MGTRSRTEVYEHGKCLVSIYRQMDGYPTGQGADLLEFLSSGKMVNGIASGDDQHQFNGASDLAAQLVWFLKRAESDPSKPKVGSIYLHAPMVEDGECGEEYIYRITALPNPRDAWGPSSLLIQVSGGDMTAFGCPNDPASFKGLFSGDLAAYRAWIKKQVAAEKRRHLAYDKKRQIAAQLADATKA